MNRAKKEEAKKLREAYESMSPEELEEFERRRRIKSSQSKSTLSCSRKSMIS